MFGVNENTVRRWEERGLLRAARLPSGARRFRPEDVEAMRAEMFIGFASLREDHDVALLRACARSSEPPVSIPFVASPVVLRRGRVGAAWNR